MQIHEPGQSPVPHQDEADLAVGIDLGTTNSVVAISSEGKIEVLKDDDGNALVPSIVAYAPDGSAIVGELAKRLLLSRPDSVVSSIKRLMGRGAEDVKSLGGQLPFDIEPHHEGESQLVSLNIGGHTLTPIEISADILRALKDRAEDQLGAKVEKAVITMPAYFDDAQRTATNPPPLPSLTVSTRRTRRERSTVSSSILVVVPSMSLSSPSRRVSSRSRPLPETPISVEKISSSV